MWLNEATWNDLIRLRKIDLWPRPTMQFLKKWKPLEHHNLVSNILYFDRITSLFQLKIYNMHISVIILVICLLNKLKCKIINLSFMRCDRVMVSLTKPAGGISKPNILESFKWRVIKVSRYRWFIVRPLRIVCTHTIQRTHVRTYIRIFILYIYVFISIYL